MLEKIQQINKLAKELKKQGLAKTMDEAMFKAEKIIANGDIGVAEITAGAKQRTRNMSDITSEDEKEVAEILRQSGVKFVLHNEEIEDETSEDPEDFEENSKES
jgi:hypothetical protein